DSQSERRRERAFEVNRAAIESSYRKRDPGLSAAAVKKAWFAETPLGMIEHQAAWHPTGEIGRWAAHNPAVALIGETIFVHGGISPAYTAVPIEEINRRVAAALAAQETAPDSIINDPAGPLWYRGLAGRTSEGGAAPAGSRQEVDAVLGSFGARRIVIGHTPVRDGIRLLHDGRLVLADTGISAAYGGVWSYLELVGSEARAHVVPKVALRERWR
ncbi:MAG TPA: hypothetical protein VGR19_08805, partial [Allosphingosinicella sp.]|nr:hypothetical protein [Allosphingosinicella sp.]